MSTNPDIKVKKIFKIRRKKTQSSVSSSVSDSSQDNKPKRRFKIKKKTPRDTSSQGVVSSEISSSLLSLLVTSSDNESISSVIETKTVLSNYSVNIIVPFRDNLVLKSKANQNRSEHLREFKEYMITYFLPLVTKKFKSDGIDANIKITIVEQSQDGNRFNRGALLNAGYLNNPNYDVYIFHDVDLLPNDNMINIYSTRFSQNDIIHFAGGWDRYTGTDYIGGVTLIGRQVFLNINGFPNDYWGWGGEDDEIKRRLESINLYSNLTKINIEDSYRDLEDIKTVDVKRKMLKSNALELDNIIRRDQATQHSLNWRTNGLVQDVDNFYTILDTINEGSNFTSLLVNLDYKIIKPTLDEVALRPDLFQSSESKDSTDIFEIKESITKEELEIMFNIENYVTSYDSYDECNQNKNQFPYITNPLIFNKLLDTIDLDDFEKKLEVSEKMKLTDPIYQGKFTKETIINTFNYMFYKIRLGVFVLIKDNKVKYFIPFHNLNYVNNWSSFINFSDSINNIDEYEIDRKPYIRDSINKNINTWGANNCILGTWEDTAVGDMGWSEMLEMLIETCSNREVNDSIFFYNRRDNPVITKNRTEPYNHIFNGYEHPLEEEFSHETYIPIVGYCKNDQFSDVLIPIYADWRDITGKYYPTSCQNMNVSDIVESWDQKHPIAVFRGSATGCGVTPHNNDRIAVSLISNQLRSMGNNSIMDAGLTGFNLRDKKISGGPVAFFKYKDAGLDSTVERIPMNGQSSYKYIIHIDGHVSAYRLGKELSLHSCIIKVKSRGDYYVWFSNQLVPFNPRKNNLETANMVEISSVKANLIQTIQYLQKNDTISKKIAENANDLYTKIMNRDNIYNYTQGVINKISMNYYSI
jgi:hypothetical protein